MFSRRNKKIIIDVGEFMNTTLNSRDWSHGVEHAEAVAQNSINIWNRTDKDEYVWAEGDPLVLVITAALLHDVCDHKYLKYIDSDLPSKMNNFIEETLGIQEAIIINNIITNVSYSKELRGELETLEPHVQFLRDIVSDADKLEAIGEIGVRRCIAYQQEMSDNEMSGLTAEEVSEKAITYFKTSLLQIYPTYFRTKVGLELAKPRYEYVVKWLMDK
jgi:uncharacterized protein